DWSSDVCSSDLRRTSFVKGEIETPVSRTNGKRRPVGPLVHQHPFDGPVSVALIGMTRAGFMSRRPLSSLLADPLRSDTCRFGDGRPLAGSSHLAELADDGFVALHVKLKFHRHHPCSPVQTSSVISPRS